MYWIYDTRDFKNTGCEINPHSYLYPANDCNNHTQKEWGFERYMISKKLTTTSYPNKQKDATKCFKISLQTQKNLRKFTTVSYDLSVEIHSFNTNFLTKARLGLKHQQTRDFLAFATSLHLTQICIRHKLINLQQSNKYKNKFYPRKRHYKPLTTTF